MALQFPSPSPPPGCDVTLVRQDETGKFDLSFATSGPNKGNPSLDVTRTHAVLTTLISQKPGRRPQSQVDEGGYYWDESGRRGTLIWTVTQDRTSTPSQLQAYADDGGQQLIDMRYLKAFSSSAERVRQACFRLRVRWVTPTGDWSTTLNF